MYNRKVQCKNKTEVLIMFDLNGIPQGLGMALSRNGNAMNNFSHLSDDERKKLIELSRSVRSKQEMNRLVDKLGHGKDQLF